MNKVDQWKDLIIKSSECFRIDAHLIEAIIVTESSGDADATRFEPKWHLYNNPQFYCDHLGISKQEEEVSQATSWGLMQVMGAVARDLGYTEDLKMLLVPEVGIFYGCKKLKQLMQRYGSEEAVVSAYNQGNARMANGMYMNQRYVDKVYAYLRQLRALV